MLLKAPNRTLIDDIKQTTLTASASIAATTLTVKDYQGFGIGDWIIVGEIGEEGSEVIRLHAVTAPTGTTITLAGGLINAHGIDSPVYRTDYDKAQFYRATTATGTKTQLGSDVDIDPSDEFTYYEDTSNTTGYGFVRWYNSSDSTASSYSGAVNYERDEDKSSYDRRTLTRMTKRVRNHLGEKEGQSSVSDDEIRDALNTRQEDIAHSRHWRFYEIERSASSVDDQFAYTTPTDIDRVQLATFDTQPLAPISDTKWKNLHWDTDTSSSNPSHYKIYKDETYFYPRPNASANADAIDDVTNITATDTTITVDDSSGFKRGDYYRFIIESEVIYATGATATTFTGCLRGREGTTAATHNNNTVITERDIVWNGQEVPTDLFLGSDRTNITEPLALELGASMEIAYGNLKDNSLGDRLKILYEAKFKDLKSKYAMKVYGQFSRIKDKSEIISDNSRILNMNNFPSDITGI